MPVSRKNQNLPKLWQSIKPQQSVRQFENTIIQFHNNHRTSIRQLPYVLGKKINLRKLYINVIKRGGYKKVNENSEWEDVLDDLNLPKETTNCELAIQTIYHRYLEDYEREQWNSLSSYPDNYSTNNTDNNSMDINISKHSSYISELAIRDKSFLAAFVNDNTPKVFCDYQHIIHSSTRSESGLSCDFKEPTEFNHLKISLQSGLLNEVEFALNTLLIMSNSNHIRFDLRFTGNLVDLMLATVGVFDPVPCSYYEQFKDCSWMTECLQFWNNTVEDGVGRIFLIPNIFKISKSEIRRLLRNTDIASSQPDSSQLFNRDSHSSLVTDPCAERVHLVATVLYNLTNDSPSNSRAVINNFQFLRFVFLSVHSSDPVLRRLGLQTLSRMRFVLYPFTNTSSLQNTFHRTAQHKVDIDEQTPDEDDNDDEWFSQFLLDLVTSLLSSENRCDRISALEMVQTLCLIEENQQILNKSLKSSFVAGISSQLLVPDIHPLCCALESLVSLSQLGEDMCRRMAMCQALLKVLLQFIQIEAQMFGPSAVYKIKTFNHRPPISMPTYHSLPQIMRFPSNSPLRQPFMSPGGPSGSIVNFVEPNIQLPCSPGNIALSVSAANCNSISTHCLSKLPLLNPMKAPQMFHHQYNNTIIPNNNNNNNNIIPNNIPNSNNIVLNHINNYNGNSNQSNIINNILSQSQSANIQSYKPSQLTPLQQIDQLLTKSIASFENPVLKKEDPIVNEEEKRRKEKEQEINAKESVEDNIIDSKQPMGDKRVVQIKYCADSRDYEIGEINGAKLSPEREAASPRKSESVAWTPVSTNVSNQQPAIVNGNDSESRLGLNGVAEQTGPASKEHRRDYMNGTLEIDATHFDDPDRRQMPPPSLPTPSMLKKQMRPKLSPPSQLGVANGYLQQLNSKVKRKLVSEMTLTTNAQIEDRCDRAKVWLRQHYRFSDDLKVFVLKQDLVNELHEFLFEDDNDDILGGQASKRIFSAHELHSCIKDVFGHKVQVKVEHRLNGKSQLIYSNLSRITQSDHEKVIPNGVVNPLAEMNGFIHHPMDRKHERLNHDRNENSVPDKQDDKNMPAKSIVNQTNCAIKHRTNPRTKRLRKLLYPQRKKVSIAIVKAQNKLLLARKIKLRVSMKFQPKLYKMSFGSATTSTSGDSSTTASSPPILESQQFLSINTNETHTNDVYLAVACLWGSCTQRFPDDSSLNFHLTNDHIPITTENNLSPSRTTCQWQHCLTASVPRAPLSLLSHVIQEHCSKSNQSTFQSPNNMPQRMNNPLPYNIASPPTIHPSMSPNHFGQISEKSGWSVLYDHFRMNEQMQPNLPEGPITKHIRISSSIILRNMSRHSIITKEFLKNNESLLSYVAMSNQDCAPIIVQCLDELSLATGNDS